MAQKKYVSLKSLQIYKENSDSLYAKQESLDELSGTIGEKANANHAHAIADVTNLQSVINEIDDNISQKSQVQVITSDTSEVLSALKIHKLTQEEYNRVVEDGNLEDNAIYLTPDEEIDLSGYATKEDLNNKSDSNHNHDEIYYTKTNIDEALENKAASTHNHEIDDVNGLQDILDGKASQSDLNTLETAINNKANATHQHNVEDINELQSTLDTLAQNISTKANAQHNHGILDITNLQSSLDEIDDSISQKSQVQVITSNTSESLSTLKIHKLTQEEYDQIVSDNALEDNAIYLTPNEEVDLSSYATVEQLNGKADTEHSHDDVYYTEVEIDTLLESKANTNHNHDDKYDTKGAADEALDQAKSYADTAATNASNIVKSDLLNGAEAAYDTLKELGDLINENVDAIEALEIVASGKANAVHSHDDRYYTESEIDNKVSTINTSITTSLNTAKSYSDTNLHTAKAYADNAVAQKTQVQIITWGVDD